MDPIYQILIIVIPSGIVFLTTFYLTRTFLSSESRKRVIDLKLANQQLITPLRLQAYERVVLLLERISPNSLVLRVHKNGMSARYLQSELIKNIRDEFDHNLSQQVYMTQQAWEKVKSAKEENIKLINVAGAQIADDASGLELGQKVLEVAAQLKKQPSEFAIEFLKKEISQTF